MKEFEDDDVVTTRDYRTREEVASIVSTDPGKPVIGIRCHPGTGALTIATTRPGRTSPDQIVHIPHGMLRSLIEALTLVQDRMDAGWPARPGMNIN